MKTKLTIFLFFLCLNVFGQTVPNTTTFSLQNVVNATGGASLQEAFDLSIDSLFDPTYKGDKTNLLNFRNYGYYYITYGALYSWGAASTAANIANTGWHVPTHTEWETLTDYLGGISVAGGKLKETGTTHWKSPNTGATNAYGFTARPGGYRYIDGVYHDITMWGRWWCKDSYSGTEAWGSGMDYNTDNFEAQKWYLKHGLSVLLVKDATCPTEGVTGIYTGNDGQVYPTICIGNQQWMTENLRETKYRNGVAIALITDNAAWAAATTGARCFYTITP